MKSETHQKQSGTEERNADILHCTIIGDAQVGKTCLAQQCIPEEYTTTIFENYAVPVEVGGKDFIISLFDTSSEGHYEPLRAYTYGASEVLLLCFSVCDRQSFDSLLNKWLPEIRKHLSKKHTSILLVGTKADLRVQKTTENKQHRQSHAAEENSKVSESDHSAEAILQSVILRESEESQEVTQEEGRRLAEVIGADNYIECSTFTQEGLDEIFRHVVFSALKFRHKSSRMSRFLAGVKPLKRVLSFSNILKRIGSLAQRSMEKDSKQSCELSSC